ncbi:hypothetical protein Q1695_007203 [Nippostrongylus brasiliensis]|nr:hypothetical protein Q1695_007203 [Nippostrongylus brasiliensis]
MPDEEAQIDGMTDEGEKSQISGVIAFEDVYSKYPQRPRIPILRGLNVSIKPGQTQALVGPGGCGKSTVISLLERLYDPGDNNSRIYKMWLLRPSILGFDYEGRQKMSNWNDKSFIASA